MGNRNFLGFTNYQWLVLFAAWLGWGFDVFDALLFNYVARLCIPALLPPGMGTPQAVTQWTGVITSVLLLGWGVGGIMYGKITDRIGRSRALLYTMLTYAIATAACAFAPNLWFLIVCRFVAALGIGGEWAAGAALVAETVPENRRVHAGALLYTASPAGLFLATFVTDLFTRQLGTLADNPELAWRAVFLTGLIPAAIAFWIRLKVREPEGWKPNFRTPKIRELFTPELYWITLGGMAMALVALLTWWSCNAFIPNLISFLVADAYAHLPQESLAALKSDYVRIGTSWFNLGGLVGTLLTIPAALYLGRRKMFYLYFALSAASIAAAFALPLEVETRLLLLFVVGVPVFGVFGSFPFYLPELFPMHLRATGSGFCYNVGRFITAAGPFVVAYFSRTAQNGAELMQVISWVALIPLLGLVLLFLGLGEEVRTIKPQRLQE